MSSRPTTKTESVKPAVPQDVNAEKFLLGCLMQSGCPHAQIFAKLTPGDFYDPKNQIVFRAAENLFNSLQPIDVVTLCDEISNLVNIEKIGGRSYVVDLSEDIYSAANSLSYADIIAEKSHYRRLMTFGSEIYTASSQEQPIDDINQKIALQAHSATISEETPHDTTAMAIAVLQPAVGVLTGFPRIDSGLFCLENGQLICIAGRPGSGKTALAIDIAEYASKNFGAAAFFSLEMSLRQIGRRIGAYETGIPAYKIRNHNLTEAQKDKVQEVILESKTLWDVRSDVSASDILRACRIIINNNNSLSLIVVDYLQIMKHPEFVDGNENRQIGGTTKALKSIAKELDVPVIMLSQLSRENVKSNRRPNLSDLRGSGSIEQDCDVVIFVHRPDETTEDAEIIVAKNRDGATFVVNTTFDSNRVCFSK